MLLRLYLLAGLVAHKAVWELLKRRRPGAASAPAAPVSPGLLLIKGVKVSILLGLVAQTILPEILPISDAPAGFRVAGMLLYSAGLVVAIVGRLQLGDSWADIEAAPVLEQQQVVTTGLYHYIRHPIYTGDLLLLAGLELALNSWLVLGVGLLLPYVVWRAVREEKMLAHSLPGYAAYRAATARFVPFVF